MEATDLGQDEQAIKQALRNFTIPAGFDRFAYLNVRGSETSAFSDYPNEWLRLYLERGCATIDPVVVWTKRTMQAFI